MKRPRDLKKYTILAIVFIVTIVALVKLNAVGALLLLYLVGVVPGTNYVLPPNVMSLFFSAAISFVLFWPFILMVLRMILATHLNEKQQASISRFVKRRTI